MGACADGGVRQEAAVIVGFNSLLGWQVQLLDDLHVMSGRSASGSQVAETVEPGRRLLYLSKMILFSDGRLN